MAYKAVFINESHIAHSSWTHGYNLHSGGARVGGPSYQYVPTHNGIGNPHHGVGGMFTQNPAGSNRVNYMGSGPSNVSRVSEPHSNRSSYMGSGPSNKSRVSEPESPAPSANVDKETYVPVEMDIVKNTNSYANLDPKLMTDTELQNANTRALREANYLKNYPDTATKIASAANTTANLVNQGASFAKKLIKDPEYRMLDLSGMSNEDLQAANRRAQLETEYNRYFNPPQQNKAREWVDIVASGVGFVAATTAAAAPFVIYALKNRKKAG